MDRQGSSTHWLSKRPDSLPKIHSLPRPAAGSGTVRVGGDDNLDAWSVKDARPDFALLVQGVDEVRLVLNEDSAL